MKPILTIVFYALFSGITIYLGGLLSRYCENIKESILKKEILHGSVAFGGGILIAAVAFVLAPQAIESLSLIPLVLIFLMGAFSFLFLDKFIEQKGGRLAQFLAMLMDYIPEVIALGAVFAHDSKLGLLLAIFIGLQNFPEAFNAYTDLRSSGLSSRHILNVFFPLSFIGVVAALSGNYFLSEKPTLIASLMIFASGGIVYLMFQDIAPMSKMRNKWGPAIGASLGFSIGIIGEKILGG